MRALAVLVALTALVPGCGDGGQVAGRVQQPAVSQVGSIPDTTASTPVAEPPTTAQRGPTSTSGTPAPAVEATAPATAPTTTSAGAPAPATVPTTTIAASPAAPPRLASHLFIPVGEARSIAGLGDLVEVVAVEGTGVVSLGGAEVEATAGGTACLRFAYRDNPGENGVQTLCVVSFDEVGDCVGLEWLGLDLEGFADTPDEAAGDANLLEAGAGRFYAVCRTGDGLVRLQQPTGVLPPLFFHMVDALGDGPYSLGDEEMERQRAGHVTTADGTTITPPWILPVSWEVSQLELDGGGVRVVFDPCTSSPGCTTRRDAVRPGDILSIGLGLPADAGSTLMGLPEAILDDFVGRRTGIPWQEVLERDPAMHQAVLYRLVNAGLMSQMVPWFDDVHGLRERGIRVAYNSWQPSLMPLCRPEPENVVECTRLEDAVAAFELEQVEGLLDAGHDLWAGVSLDYRDDGAYHSVVSDHRPQPTAFNGVLARVSANDTWLAPDVALAMAETVTGLAAELPGGQPVVLMAAGPPITAQTGAGAFCEAEICPSDFDAAYTQFEAWLGAAIDAFDTDRLLGVGIALYEGSHFDLRRPVEQFAGFGLNRVGETGYNHPGLNVWRAARAENLVGG